MATRNRPAFFRVALACFLQQDLGDAELIVVDDGESRVEHSCAGLDRVRYIGLPGPTLLGAKLNIGIDAARADVLQKLDDDDYYGPQFLSTALAHCAGESIVAWDCFLILRAGELQLRYSGHGWRAGGTLCFPRSLWNRSPFRDAPRSVDSWFIRDARAPVIPVCAPEQYILVRHGRNTWNRMQGGTTADDFIATLPAHTRSLGSIVDERSLSFYESLTFEAG